LNGGLKTMDLAQDCPNVSYIFHQSNKIAEYLFSMIEYEEIEISGKEIKVKEPLELKL